MANHCIVTTAKLMTPACIEAMLADLNRRVFRGLMAVEATTLVPGPMPGWFLAFPGDTPDNPGPIYRPCWLATSRRFVARHGGLSRFAYWVDRVVANEVAVRFDGRCKEDANPSAWMLPQPGGFDDIHACLTRNLDGLAPARRAESLARIYLNCSPPFLHPELIADEETARP